MTAFRVLFLTSGPNVPSTRYRILPYIPYLRDLGFECDVAHSLPEKYQKINFLGWRSSHLVRHAMRLADLIRSRQKRYDAIVLERELFDDSTCFMEMQFRKVAKRFILDVDDGIFLRYPEKFSRIAGVTDVIVAGNSLIADLCARYCPNVTVIPTSVDLREYNRLVSFNPDRTPVIGWIGTASNVPYLNIALPALERLARDSSFILKIITSSSDVLRQLPVQRVQTSFQKWHPQTAISEIQQFDIGIMPLFDGEWERYKCGFKLIQYMACGLPAVASPVGVNSKIIDHECNGLLASTEEEWYRCLKRLLENREWAQKLGEAARLKVEANYSIEKHVPRLAEILKGSDSLTTSVVQHRN
jgi:Glycosyltransferase